MCDPALHAAGAHVGHVAHVSRIPLTRRTSPRRGRRARRGLLTRRRLLVDFGAAGTGLVLLAACSSDSTDTSDTGGVTTSGPGPADTPAPNTAETTATTPPGTEAPATEPGATEPAATEPGATEPAATEPAAGGELELGHVSLGFVSAYVLARGDEAAIVDTGIAGSGAAIVDGLVALGLEPASVRHVVLTHEHGDHIGGLAELEADLVNATVYAGPGDIDAVATGLPLTGVDDGDEVFGMGVIGTPGHTAGSISLFDVDTGLLVAGDAINGDGAGGLTGANPDFSADIDTATESIRRLAALMPEIAAFGHGGPPVTDDVAGKLAALG